jgi:amino acid adenylation domain-containing protein
VDENSHGASACAISAVTPRVAEWNRTTVEFDPTGCVHQVIEEGARSHPDRVALIFRNRTLTYQQLSDRAGHVARQLQACGVGPDMPVAIAIERSLEMVVAILAVLKAGGAYLPLDPAFPQERTDFMLADSDARAILTSADLHQRFADAAAPVLRVDTDSEPLNLSTAPPPSTQVNGHDLAYLMYTSGSTGKPKGVMVEHRNVINFFAGMDRVIGPNDAGVWLAVTSISFDISVLELLWTLARGFTVIIQPEEGKLEITGEDSIPALIAQHGVTHLQCTPAHARMLARSASARGALSSLRHWLIGGEAFPLALAQQLRAALKARIINMYGPTETTVWSTCYELSGGEASIPIGRPIANTQVYVLDAAMAPAPIGEAGELYIGGAGVTRGYWRRPELTAERFVADPFTITPGAKLYRTGDLVKFGEGGLLEFLGRADFQIKIRGFRIELGEIETVLGAHPGIREAVVIAQPNLAGDPQLAAYVVAHEEQGLSAAELRIYSRQKLPNYMAPASYTFLDALPMTPNGKVDRKALSTAHGAHSGSTSTDGGVATSELEKTIVAIWRELLGLATIGLHGNLFDLGATSLTVAEAANRLREVLGREIKLTDLFAYPTVSSLAAYLGRPEPHPAAGPGSGRGAARRDALAARASRKR